MHLVGLGYGDGRHMTLDGADALLSARRVILRTARCGAAGRLLAMEVACETCDDLYDAHDTFDAVCDAIAERVCAHARKGGDIAFATPGGGGIGDIVMQRVARVLDGAGVGYRVHPAAGLAEGLAFEVGGVDQANIAFAIDIPAQACDPRKPLIVLEIDTPLLASEVKVRLLDAYPHSLVARFRAHDGTLSLLALPDLDRQGPDAYGIETALLLPAVPLIECTRFDARHLEEIMAILRGRGGCPWDRQQTHESLKPAMIEEAWEVLAAIDDGDPDRLADELGDVLLQAAFHAQIAREHGDFTFDDIATAVCQKMIRRHPHIFGEATAATSDEVLKNWETIKKAEKGLTSPAESMRDVPSSFPGLLRAQKVQGKDEEKDAGKLAAAVGDMLFAAARVARQSGVNAELSLHAAVERFITHKGQEEDPK